MWRLNKKTEFCGMGNDSRDDSAPNVVEEGNCSLLLDYVNLQVQHS